MSENEEQPETRGTASVIMSGDTNQHSTCEDSQPLASSKGVATLSPGKTHRRRANQVSGSLAEGSNGCRELTQHLLSNQQSIAGLLRHSNGSDDDSAPSKSAKAQGEVVGSSVVETGWEVSQLMRGQELTSVDERTIGEPLAQVLPGPDRCGSEIHKACSSECEDPRETASCHQFLDRSGADGVAFRKARELEGTEPQMSQTHKSSTGAAESDLVGETGEESKTYPVAETTEAVHSLRGEPDAGPSAKRHVMVPSVASRSTSAATAGVAPSSQAPSTWNSQKQNVSTATSQKLRKELERTQREILEVLGEDDDASFSGGSAASSISYTSSQIDGLSRIQEHIGNYLPILQEKGFNMSFQEAFSVGQKLLNRQTDTCNKFRSRACSPAIHQPPTERTPDTTVSCPRVPTEIHSAVRPVPSSAELNVNSSSLDSSTLQINWDPSCEAELTEMCDLSQDGSSHHRRSTGGGAAFGTSCVCSLSTENDELGPVLDAAHSFVIGGPSVRPGFDPRKFLPRYQEELRRLNETLGCVERELESRQRRIVARIKQRKMTNDCGGSPELDGQPVSFWVLPPKDRGG